MGPCIDFDRADLEDPSALFTPVFKDDDTVWVKKPFGAMALHTVRHALRLYHPGLITSSVSLLL